MSLLLEPFELLDAFKEMRSENKSLDIPCYHGFQELGRGFMSFICHDVSWQNLDDLPGAPVCMSILNILLITKVLSPNGHLLDEDKFCFMVI